MARAGEPSDFAFWSFALRFVAGFAVFYALLYAAPFSVSARDAYCRVLATTTAFALEAVGIGAEADGALVLMDSFSYRIVLECDGLVLLALFVPAVLAARVPKCGWDWARLARSVSLLVLLNWMRLVGYGVISSKVPVAKPLAHDFVFQAISIAVLVVLFLGWVAPRAPLEETATPAASV